MCQRSAYTDQELASAHFPSTHHIGAQTSLGVHYFGALESSVDRWDMSAAPGGGRASEIGAPGLALLLQPKTPSATRRYTRSNDRIPYEVRALGAASHIPGSNLQASELLVGAR